MSDIKPFLHDNIVWGFLENEVFIPLPKLPMLLAGHTKAPFTVSFPDGRVRHIIEQPSEGGL